MSCELCGHRNEIQQGNYKLSRSVSVLERPAADQSPGNVWRRICIIAGLGLLYFTICLMTDTRTHTALLSPCLALLHFRFCRDSRSLSLDLSSPPHVWSKCVTLLCFLWLCLLQSWYKLAGLDFDNAAAVLIVRNLTDGENFISSITTAQGKEGGVKLASRHCPVLLL